jgi:hypothetical protein
MLIELHSNHKTPREQIKSKSAIELLNLGGRVDLGRKMAART